MFMTLKKTFDITSVDVLLKIIFIIYKIKQDTYSFATLYTYFSFSKD